MNDIVVYWRPGCPFCSSPLRQLDRRGVPHRRIDIWSDPTATARVRLVANGNETVPTESIGGRSLINPGVHAVLAVAEELAPHAVPDDYVAPQSGRFGRWLAGKLAGSSAR